MTYIIGRAAARGYPPPFVFSSAASSAPHQPMNAAIDPSLTAAPGGPATAPMELVCPAGSLPALKAAVDNGADCVYLGFRDATNARNFAGLNFDAAAIATGIRYAHDRGRKVFVALNTYPQAAKTDVWQGAVDKAADSGVDAVILADPGLMAYAVKHQPQLRLHLSVQGSATNYEALDFYYQHFGISRAVLPRVLSMVQVEQLMEKTPIEIEVFGFGSLCVMVEGRCALSSYVTGEAPNSNGVCSPPKAVRWVETPQGRESRLNGVLIDRYAPGENAGYPTLCKGRFDVEDDHNYYAIEEPTSLNTLSLLPQLMTMGVRAIKIEGRQRSPAYVAQVTKVWRQAIDSCRDNPHRYTAKPAWVSDLDKVAEGQQHTLGAYHRPWK
ncbi:MAG: protease [Rhodoferax ferrireducens]|uniref:Ubiquinone biosynthesis protein UbiU n=2 Tax=Pseudomonadota TaxID=1224 RepID=A0A1Y1R0D0_9GAMM|nr:MAG: protease [Rhodoferax ferrireducens]OQX17458.1 MAG: protease [Thiothrix lacustris]